MNKYIEADKLKVEIERRIEWLNTATSDFGEGRRAELRSLYDFIIYLQQEQPEVDLEKAARNVYKSWIGGTMDDFLRDMAELLKALNARKEE